MKALWLVPVIAGAVLLVRRCGPEMGSLCGRMFEAMPEDFPPKQMHRNILAIREQNERILQLLEELSQARS